MLRDLIKSDISFRLGLYDTDIFGKSTAVLTFRVVFFPEGILPHTNTPLGSDLFYSYKKI